MSRRLDETVRRTSTEFDAAFRQTTYRANMRKKNINVGTEYKVVSSRKGAFKMRVTSIEGEWIEGEITSGSTVRGVHQTWEHGETITVRKGLCEFYGLIPKP